MRLPALAITLSKPGKSFFVDRHLSINPLTEDTKIDLIYAQTKLIFDDIYVGKATLMPFTKRPASVCYQQRSRWA